MNLPEPWLSLVALAALVIAGFAVALVIVQQRRYRQLLGRFRLIWAEGSGDAASVLARQQKRIDAEARRIDQLEGALTGVHDDLAQVLQHIAVVRYDAFGDMGGRLSFSAAIIDDRGDGMVISSIHARGESRTYAKGVIGGKSDVTLTPEEQQALAAAKED